MKKNHFREYTLLDQLIGNIDQSLRSMVGEGLHAERPNPAAEIAETSLSTQEKKHSAGLMRVDHAGEVCAQALYQGQALTARQNEVKTRLQKSADEEIDHLSWCATRLQELNSHRSFLNPIWSVGSFAMGAVAGAMGDRWSLGFVVETERQVVQHLEQHLATLPTHDQKSRAILEQMREDEAHHASVALEAGGASLPSPIRTAMKWMSKIMTKTAYLF